MFELMSYIGSMDNKHALIRQDRIRAGKALGSAIDRALAKSIVNNYVEIGLEMGFNRTNIAHHKKGTRPMSREVVLRYADVLQCEPDQIADDDVQMELAKDLERYESDLSSYLLVKNYCDSDRTPLKLPRELVEVENIPDNELSTIAIYRDDSPGSNSPKEIVVIWSNGKKPVNSDKLHVVFIDGKPLVAKIVEDRNGYIITPERPLDGQNAPMFRTAQDLIQDGIIIAGQVFWRFSKV